MRLALLFLALSLWACTTTLTPPPDAGGGATPSTGGYGETPAAGGTGGWENPFTGGDSAETGGTTGVRCEFVQTNGASKRERDKAARVINGQPAPMGRFPWAVSLQAGSHYCTGEIIAPSWVLTAGHCEPRPGETAVAGRLDLRDTSHGHVRVIDQGYAHERFVGYRTGFDFALAHVSTPFTGIIPATLRNEPPDYGGVAEIAGWGRTCSTCATSPVLLFAEVTVIRNEACSYFGLTSTMLCATGLATDAAPGDSGGGIYQLNGTTGKVEQIGVVSWGADCDPNAGERCDGVYGRLEGMVPGILACVE